jgi:hypothetical protein
LDDLLLMKGPVLTRLVTALWDQARSHEVAPRAPHRIPYDKGSGMDEDATAEHDEGACKAREVERAEKNLGKEDEKLA